MKNTPLNKTLRRAITAIKKLYYADPKNNRERDYNQYVDTVLTTLEIEFDVEIPE